MNEKEYNDQLDELFKEWKEKRRGYEKLTEDGILIFKKWEEQPLKILFLLKEAYQKDTCFRKNPLQKDGAFNNNIGLWRYLLLKIWKEPTKPISFSDANKVLSQDPHNLIGDIAIVEVKKNNEGKGTSKPKDILKYAKDDKGYLQKQIDLINPHIVVCCGTGDSYFEIYGWNNKVNPLNTVNKKYSCYSHSNRLMIDFYHPSHKRYSGGFPALFELLGVLLKNGNVFQEFDWSKKA